MCYGKKVTASALSLSCGQPQNPCLLLHSLASKPPTCIGRGASPNAPAVNMALEP